MMGTNRVRWLLASILMGLAAVLLAAGGCERRIPKEDLGKVVFEVPEIPGPAAPQEPHEPDAKAAPKPPPSKP
jgi:hypothetical protein